MKQKLTKKELKNLFKKSFSILYCEAQYIEKILTQISVENPIGYLEGTLGWNADVYDLTSITGESVAIITGSRPLSYGKQVHKETFQDLEHEAEKLYRDSQYDGTSTQEAYIEACKDIIIRLTNRLLSL